MKRISIGIVGLGKIAVDQHVPAISRNEAFELAAVASRNAKLTGIANFHSLDELLEAMPDIDAIALCMPPAARYTAARTALRAGKHVLMEKPPGATVSEVQSLAQLASQRGLTLFATWHSRYAPAVGKTKSLLNSADILDVEIQWKEDVRHWHPKQAWIWEPGGLGVFDPGINAFSILTEILPDLVYLQKATLEFPENRATPIAAELQFRAERSYSVRSFFDWRQTGPQTWDIKITSSAGVVTLSKGGTALSIDGVSVPIEPKPEYEALYDRFAALLRSQTSDVDLVPLQHVADAFMLGERRQVAPFFDD